MKRLVNFDFVDIAVSSRDIIFCIESNGKLAFKHLDINTQIVTATTKGAYLSTKFGSAFEKITELIGDIFTCETARAADGSVYVAYPGGEIGCFGQDGSLIWTNYLLYDNCPAQGICYDKSGLWAAVPGRRSIILYNPSLNRITLRIGGASSTAFISPVSIYILENDIYICDCDAMAIKKVNMENLTVSDFMLFNEKVYKYFCIGKKPFVILDSGIYEL